MPDETPIPLLVTRNQAAEIIRALRIAANQAHAGRAFWQAQDFYMLALQIETQAQHGLGQ